MDHTLFAILFLVIFANVTSRSVKIMTLCNDSNKTCKIITDCPSALNLLSTLKNNETNKEETIDKLRSMSCGYDGNYPKVCCPFDTANSIVFSNKSDEAATNRPKTSTDLTNRNASETVETEAYTEMPLDIEVSATSTPSNVVQSTPDVIDPFPNRSICGQITEADRIYGGTVTNIDEFPWLARIRYKRNGRGDSFNCAASLITDRYLISAAHCFSNPEYKPVSVRLGEWSTESSTSCVDDICIDPPIEIEIENIKVHPAFSKINITNGDIALIRLKQAVKYSDFVQPVCLPTTELIQNQDYLLDSSYWTSGWGMTEFGEPSVVKLKVMLSAVPMDICRSAIPRIPESSSPNLICAGGRKGKDSCQGDSGGPLMREVSQNYNTNWFLYGIVSFGSKVCGTEGQPAVYTRVTKYMTWIRENVET